MDAEHISRITTSSNSSHMIPRRECMLWNCDGATATTTATNRHGTTMKATLTTTTISTYQYQ